MPQTLIHERSQCSQLISAEDGATGADRHNQIGFENIRPLDGQRAKPSVGARIGHAVSAPVITYREQIESLSSQWMERMRDSENLCAMLVTICNARLTPRDGSSPASAM